MEHLTVETLLASWGLQPIVLLVLVTLGSVYTAGWRRLRRSNHPHARGWRLIVYLAGLLMLAAALLPPIDDLASLLFLAHMVQHLLLTMWAAPLLLLGNPLPVCLWGLPRRVRRPAGRLLTPNAAFRRTLWALTFMPVAWLLYVGDLWIWHLPVAYEAALRHELIHALEHVALFGTALLFWWPIIEPAPRLHGRAHYVFGIVYLIAATGQNTLLSGSIALAPQVLYPFYAAAPRLFDLSPLDDQASAGALMWISGHMYLLPILLLVKNFLDREERMTRYRETARQRRAGTENGRSSKTG